MQSARMSAVFLHENTAALTFLQKLVTTKVCVILCLNLLQFRYVKRFSFLYYFGGERLIISVLLIEDVNKSHKVNLLGQVVEYYSRSCYLLVTHIYSTNLFCGQTHYSLTLVYLL